MSYGNDRPPSLQEILNQPFEFQEVLLSPKERARVQKGLDSSQLFVPAGGDAGSGGLVVNEFRLREISVRLRTINNACDSMATMPDGTPISEVSLYGSRERQYLVGPYKSLKWLMAGNMPADTRKRRSSNLSRLKTNLVQAIRNEEAVIPVPEGSETPRQLFMRPVRPPTETEIEEAKVRKIAYEELQGKLATLESTFLARPKTWWEPWSSESSALDKDIEAVEAAIREISDQRIATQQLQPGSIRIHTPRGM